MSIITTPASGRTSDDILVRGEVVPNWSQANPDLDNIQTPDYFIKEQGLKSLISDSVTSTASSTIASSNAVNIANKRYISEDYTDGEATPTGPGETSIGRFNSLQIGSDGEITAIKSIKAQSIEAISLKSSFQNMSVGGNNPAPNQGIAAVGLIHSDLLVSAPNGTFTERVTSDEINTSSLTADTINVASTVFLSNTGISSTSGNITLNTGQVTLEDGSIDVINGDINNTNGDINAFSGDITASDGYVIAQNLPKINIRVTSNGTIESNLGPVTPLAIVAVGAGFYRVRVTGGAKPNTIVQVTGEDVGTFSGTVTTEDPTYPEGDWISISSGNNVNNSFNLTVYYK